VLRSVGVKIGVIGPNACYFSTSKELIDEALYLDLEDLTQSISRKKKGEKMEGGQRRESLPLHKELLGTPFPP